MAKPKRYEKIAFVASAGAEAQQALAQLAALYGNHAPADADVVVALGGAVVSGPVAGRAQHFSGSRSS